MGKVWAIDAYITKVFGKDAKIAIAISKAENRGRICSLASKPNTNGTIDYGLFQINGVHKYPLEQVKDCKNNINLAYRIYKSSGFQAWSTYKSKVYKRYL